MSIHIPPPRSTPPPPPPPPHGKPGTAAPIATVYNGPCWVRWGEFAGKTPWRPATRVAITDGWLIITGNPSGGLLIPQHYVRGHVEIVTTDPGSTT